MKPLIVQPVKLFIAILYREHYTCRNVLDKCQELFGSIDHHSKEFFFDFTNYYEPEMGKPLFRMINSFKNLIDPGYLADVKLKTNQIEADFALADKRQVNLDPGYLDYDKLVLASAKYNFQKIYLAKGIYADPTMFYRKGRFLPCEWAFPDFKAGIYEDDLLQIRHLYKLQLKTERNL